MINVIFPCRVNVEGTQHVGILYVVETLVGRVLNIQFIYVFGNVTIM